MAENQKLVSETTRVYQASRSRIMQKIENRQPFELINQSFGIWFVHDAFRGKGGLINHLAVLVYSCIVNWHLEGKTGKPKFKHKYLQLSHKKIGKQFGATYKQIRVALDVLEDNNLIKRHYGLAGYPNQMFIEFNVDLFEEIMSVYEINEIAKAVQDLDKSIDEFVDDEINPEHFTEFSY